MFSYDHFIGKETELAAVLMPASPDAERVVAAQPLEDLAYQILGDPNALEIVTAPDSSGGAKCFRKHVAACHSNNIQAL